MVNLTNNTVHANAVLWPQRIVISTLAYLSGFVSLDQI